MLLKEDLENHRPWRVVQEVLYERAWLRAIDSGEFDKCILFDILEALEKALEFNPKIYGSRHAVIDGREFWLRAIDRAGIVPMHRVLYEVVEDQRTVILWNASIS
ncbi:hypothetical protein GCM10007385_02160 [Tateyamaria omphalii]|nr:hypothetical protein GCM10007385_02160 [Tateyamaria omphalii]